MSLFLNCQWFAEQDELTDRMELISEVLSNAVLNIIVGKQWYFLGRSRKEALSNPLSPNQLRSPEIWRFKNLGISSGCYVMGLWNGRDDMYGISFTCEINVPSSSALDFLVFDGPALEVVPALGVSWDAVNSFARYLAEKLGGLAVISSHELIDLARDRKLEAPELAAYGAFWGRDRSNRNPGFYRLIETGEKPPFSMLTCDSWAEVQSPSTPRLDRLINLRK